MSGPLIFILEVSPSKSVWWLYVVISIIVGASIGLCDNYLTSGLTGSVDLIKLSSPAVCLAQVRAKVVLKFTRGVSHPGHGLLNLQDPFPKHYGS